MKNNKKPIILLIHGLRGSHYGMAIVSKSLQDDFEVLSPDLPGTGSNPELEKQNLDGHVEWLRKYVEGLGEKPIVVGHSMGSIVVSHFIEKYPDMVDERVVLMSPILRKPAGRIASKMLDSALKGVLYPFKQESRKKILASKQVSWTIAHFLVTDRAKQKEITEAHIKYGGNFASSRSLYGDMQVSSTHETKILSSKRMLVIFGRKDRLSNYKLVRERVKTAGVEYYEFDSGHLINYERPEEVAERIKGFLKT